MQITQNQITWREALQVFGVHLLSSLKTYYYVGLLLGTFLSLLTWKTGGQYRGYFLMYFVCVCVCL